MKQKKLIFLAASLVAVSCTSVSEPDNVSQVPEEQSYLVPVEDALATADKAYKEFFGRSNTRSGKKKVERIEFFGKRTRGADPDQYGFYIINYEDDGFAMISADKRRPQSVYGISDEGSMHLSDTLSNPGLSWYLNDYVASTDDYTLPPAPIDTASLILPGSNTTTETVVVEPLLKGFMAHFSQGAPYNNNCPVLSNGARALVGCVPLAVGTIMGYYEWPLSKDNCTYNWSAMKSSLGMNPAWAYLFAQLGQSQYINVVYGSNATVTHDLTRIVTTFEKYGYTGATLKYTTIPGSDIDNELCKNSPVIIRGTNRNNNSENVDGHAWIIDGLRKRTVTGFDNVTEYYYRCVWGQGGIANGYFYFYGYYGKYIGGTPESKYEHEIGSTNNYNVTHIVTGYRPVR